MAVKLAMLAMLAKLVMLVMLVMLGDEIKLCVNALEAS